MGVLDVLWREYLGDALFDYIENSPREGLTRFLLNIQVGPHGDAWTLGLCLEGIKAARRRFNNPTPTAAGEEG